MNEAAPIQFIIRPSPFSERRIEKSLPAGLTLIDLLRETGLDPAHLHARVFIEDELIPRSLWESTVPPAGSLVTVRAIPMGGDSTKDILFTIALIIAAPYGLYYIAHKAGAPREVTSFGNLSSFFERLVPPPLPSLDDMLGTGSGESQSFSIRGGHNAALPYGTVPRVYGRIRIFPPYAARPYTEIIGDDQFLNELFCLGPGPLEISDLKIGDDPLSSFQDVQYEIRSGHATDPPLTLFPTVVLEDALSIALTSAGGWQQRTSQSGAGALSVDITFPNGLVDFDTAGNPGDRTVQVSVEYRKVGDSTWISLDVAAVKAAAETDWSGANNDLRYEAVTAGQAGNSIVVWYIETADVMAVQITASGSTIVIEYPSGSTANQIKTAIQAHAGASALVTVANKAGNDGTGVVPLLAQPIHLSGGRQGTASFSVTSNSRTQVRRSQQWPVSETAQYEIRLQRTTPDTTDVTIQDLVFWTALRTIKPNTQPINLTGLAAIALRIKATDQLNGTVDTFNCVARSILKDWDGANWVLRPTQNPASIYRDILQGLANARPLADARLHLTDLQAWHAECEAASRTWNGIFDTRTTVYEALRTVTAIGRGSFGMKDGKYSVVRDLPQSTPIQHFGTRNSWGFRATRRFFDLPHALKVRFINPAADWQTDERLVYDDGFSAANATKFEVLELPGCTDPDLAFKLARYHLAAMRLRPEQFEKYTDLENLLCTRGDLVRVTNDVPLFGLGSGRVKSVVTDGGGNVTSITMDEAFTMEAGKTYALRFRRSTGASVVGMAVTVPGEQSSISFSPVIPAASAPAAGDLILFGLAGQESVELVVKAIQPGPDLTAKLIFLDAAPGVHTADSGPIPPYTSQITLPAASQALKPNQPIIDRVLSDESVGVRDTDGAFRSQIAIFLSFVSGAGVPPDTVQVRFKPTGSAAGFTHLSSVIQGTSAVLFVQPVDDGVTYNLYARTVLAATGQTSDWTPVIMHTVIGKTTPPPNITTLVLEGRWLRWLYPLPPKDFDGFRVREQPGINADWDTAQPLHDALLKETRFFVPLKGGIRTYLVKGVDVAGNESLNPAVVSHDFGTLSFETEFGDTIPGNLIFSTDLKAAGFPGTVTNGSLIGGNLKANDNGTIFWTTDLQTFWSQDNATFWLVQYLEMTYAFTVVPDADHRDALLSLAETVIGDSYTIEYHPDSQLAFWSSLESTPFWTTNAALFWATVPDYISWPGVLVPISRQTYSFRIKTAPGPLRGEITALTVEFDVLDLTEDLAGINIASAGTRLPITKTYRTITHVHLTLLDDGGVAESVKAYDKELTGPLIKAKDGAGSFTTARVDARVKGY